MKTKLDFTLPDNEVALDNTIKEAANIFILAYETEKDTVLNYNQESLLLAMKWVEEQDLHEASDLWTAEAIKAFKSCATAFLSECFLQIGGEYKLGAGKDDWFVFIKLSVYASYLMVFPSIYIEDIISRYINADEVDYYYSELKKAKFLIPTKQKSIIDRLGELIASEKA